MTRDKRDSKIEGVRGCCSKSSFPVLYIMVEGVWAESRLKLVGVSLDE